MPTKSRTTTHVLRADNMRVAHVRGVQPVPLSLTGAGQEDRETVEAAIRQAVRLVAPLAADGVTLHWHPSGTSVTVRGPQIMGRCETLAIFRVRAAAGC